MKRAVLCVSNPQDYIDQLDNYSIMIVNPNAPPARLKYLLDRSDYSLLITNTETTTKQGKDYFNERLFWYTSGTTGDSKFYSFSQHQLDIQCRTICNAYNITKQDRYVSVMPLWHAHGQGVFWATKYAGCSTEFLSVKDIRSMPKFSPTFITAVPDVLKIVLQLDFDNLRFVRSASAPLPNDLYKALEQKFQVPVIEAFGMTEALSHCFTNPLSGPQRIGTVGLPSGISADIVDGQLYIKGPCLFTDEWFNTGDLAERDDLGYYRILGRHKDQINVKGIKLNPVSIEQQLKDSDLGIEDCVIFGSDSVKCLYVGKCDEEVVKKFLIGLGPHCWPALLKKVSAIPVSTSGKISRTWLESNQSIL